MQHIFYLLLRRLRPPMITLISVYALSITGFVLIPGQDPQGNPWHMDFFHAFYFVSFMGSTIGFGEIPYSFTTAQRVWATLSIYGTVVSWLYSIGTIFSLFQDANFRRLMRRHRFIREVKRINEPYYLICGFGVTGSRLARQLDQLNIRTVVIDAQQALIDQLETEELGLQIPSLCADAATPDVLQIAGIERDLCTGVLALTDDDHTNLAIAINSKLVKPERQVISGTQSKATTANLASFGTDLILDPFDTFADHLTLVLQEPYKHLIYDVFVNPHHKVWSSPHQTTTGRWVICGYGRFGKALENAFMAHGIAHTFISTDPLGYGAPPGTVPGTGTEAETLVEAGINEAVGVIAGTPDDADNLSIIITARDLNPDLITVARQNLRSNKPVFRAAEVNMIMEPGRIVANEIYLHIRTPLLTECFQQIRRQDETWARELLLQLAELMDEQALGVWTARVGGTDSPAVMERLAAGYPVALAELLKDPRDRQLKLPVLALMLKRGGQLQLLPAPETFVKNGDELLFCGQHRGKNYQAWALNNHTTLRYLQSGEEGPDGLIWQWLRRRKQRKSSGGIQ